MELSGPVAYSSSLGLSVLTHLQDRHPVLATRSDCRDGSTSVGLLMDAPTPGEAGAPQSIRAAGEASPLLSLPRRGPGLSVEKTVRRSNHSEREDGPGASLCRIFFVSFSVP